MKERVSIHQARSMLSLLETVQAHLTSEACEVCETKVFGYQLMHQRLSIVQKNRITIFGELNDVLLVVQLGIQDQFEELDRKLRCHEIQIGRHLIVGR